MKPNTVGRVLGDTNRQAHAQLADHGFPVGLSILTNTGPQAVELLTPGDLIATRNGGLTPLRALHAVTRATRAVVFSAGAINESCPEADMILPADQPVLLRGEAALSTYGAAQALVPAGLITNGTTIRDIGPRKLVLFRLEFDRPRIVYGGGLELGNDGMANKPLRAVA